MASNHCPLKLGLVYMLPSNIIYPFSRKLKKSNHKKLCNKGLEFLIMANFLSLQKPVFVVK